VCMCVRACVRLLSEAPAVDPGDGVGSHGAADARAGGGALGHGGDAVRRVLTGRGQGRVAGHAQSVLWWRERNHSNIKQ